MMNCLNSFNLYKDFGTVRLFLLSFLGMIGYYIVYNLVCNGLIEARETVPFHFFIYFACALVVYPLHKILHGIPFWITGYKASLTIERTGILPRMYCVISGAIPKRVYFLGMLFPLIFVTSVLSLLSVLFSTGILYYSVIGTINFGLGVCDLLCMVRLVSAPKHAFIEEDRDSLRILIKQNA